MTLPPDLPALPSGVDLTQAVPSIPEMPSMPGALGQAGGLGLVQSILAAFGPNQNARLLRLHTPLGANVLLAERMLGTETIGPRAPGVSPAGGFKFEVLALSNNAHLRLKDLIGQPVRLDLLTQQSRTELRPFHGHVTAFALLGSDGGLARYKLTIEPWLSFLSYREDAWVFQDKTVPEIIDEVFADYQAQGKLAPAWRWELADASVYARRSLCMQYHESDLAFVQRLMAEEGLFFWFEHEAAESESLGAHTLVIADHNGSLKPNVQPVVRYTQSASASFKEDSITRFDEARRVAPSALATASWDHRAVGLTGAQPEGDTRVSAEGLSLVLHDQPGAYAYETQAQAERMVQRQLEAIQAPAYRYHGEGSFRQAACGTTVSVSDHASVPAGTQWVMLTVQHRARNNILADQGSSLQSLLGKPPQAFQTQQEQAPAQSAAQQRAARPSLFKGPANQTTEPLYLARFFAQDTDIPVRGAASANEHGELIFSRPRVTGTQTAIVVGTGEPVHTDRDGRIKIQFHWQRGAQSALRLDHPASSNAPGDHTAGTWVRVAHAWAGANWGGHFTPRLGQEVVVSFIEDDIDRPVVTGSVYNGQGSADAQGNQVAAGAGTAVGDASAWFPGNQKSGELQGHQHAQVLAGYKSQSLDSSASGSGGHNQLVFDDSPAQARALLSSTTAASQLQLGHLIQQNDNQRLQKRGHGLDLATTAHGAVRAGSGLHLSAYARQQGSQGAVQSMEARAGLSQLENAQELIRTLAETAQKHNAKLNGEPAVVELPSYQAHVRGQENLSATDSRQDAEAHEVRQLLPEPSTVTATYDEQIRFVNARGAPLANIRYELKLEDGTTVNGQTDAEGRTQRVVTDQPIAVAEASLHARKLDSCCSAHADEMVNDATPLIFEIYGVTTNSQAVGVSEKQVETPKGKSRGLTSGEMTLARLLFKESIDYSAVRVHNGEYLWFGLQPNDTAMTPNGEMYFNPEFFSEDFSVLDINQQHWFIHEMVHVWQHQLGYPVKLRGAIRLGLSYVYQLDDVKQLNSFNMEAQGDVLADYFVLKHLAAPTAMRQKQYANSIQLYEQVTLAKFLVDPGHRANLPGGD